MCRASVAFRAAACVALISTDGSIGLKISRLEQQMAVQYNELDSPDGKLGFRSMIYGNEQREAASCGMVR